VKRNGIFGVLLGASALVAAVILSTAAPARQPAIPAPSVDYPIPHVPSKPAPPKEQSVEELIEQLVTLKAKEAEVTALLKAKLEKQRGGIEKLRKLGVAIDAAPDQEKVRDNVKEKAFRDSFTPQPK
jgi:type IV secretory pathway VirB10-like protein